MFASTRHSAHPNLYIKSLHGSAVVQLTSDPSSDIQPVFSPDDSRVAFASDRTGNWDIWVIDRQGGNRIRLTDGHTVNFGPAWSPSGQVLFTSARSGHENIWSVTPTTGVTPSAPITGTTRRAAGPTQVIHTGATASDPS